MTTHMTLRYPTGFARWLSAADFVLDNGKQIAVVFDAMNKDAQEMIQFIQTEYRPNSIIAASTYPPPKSVPTLLLDRPLKENKSSVYVCENFICKQPANSIEELKRLI